MQLPSNPLSLPDALEIRVEREVLEGRPFYLKLEVDEVCQLPVEVILREIPERMSQEISARCLLPSKVLQDDRIAAEWPATWWDHLKARLGFAHRTNKLRVKEIVLFPEVRLPPFGRAVTVNWTVGAD